MIPYNYEQFDAYVETGLDGEEFGHFPNSSTPASRHPTAS